MAEFYRRKKVCQMCAGKDVDYKDVMIVSKYINEKGKILPRRMTGACAKHQRHIANQIKKNNSRLSKIFVRSKPLHVGSSLFSIQEQQVLTSKVRPIACLGSTQMKVDKRRCLYQPVFLFSLKNQKSQSDFALVKSSKRSLVLSNSIG
jgi:small subunit ribosomal protein S18